MATHSSVLAWRIPGTGEPGGLPSMGSHRVRHDWSDLAAAAADHCNEFSDNRCQIQFVQKCVISRMNEKTHFLLGSIWHKIVNNSCHPHKILKYLFILFFTFVFVAHLSCAKPSCFQLLIFSLPEFSHKYLWFMSET